MTGARPAGEHAWLIELDEPAALAAGLSAGAIPGLREIVPGHETLLLVWEHSRPQQAELAGLLAAAVRIPAPLPVPAPLTIAVSYDGPDLGAVAAAIGCSPEEVVRRHLAGDYRVAFIGFAPGFAYLTGGDPVLALPRRPEPRTVVPAGAVAIAGGYSAVYPRAAPGGWHLIGRSEIVLFDPARDPPSPLAAGQAIRFEAAR